MVAYDVYPKARAHLLLLLTLTRTRTRTRTRTPNPTLTLTPGSGSEAREVHKGRAVANASVRRAKAFLKEPGHSRAKGRQVLFCVYDFSSATNGFTVN